MTKLLKSLISAALMITLLISMAACGSSDAVNLTAGMKARNRENKHEISREFIDAEIDFSICLLKQSAKQNENIFLSPISVMTVLAMTANGANENTLAEIKAVLGDLPIEDLNRELGYYIENLYNGKDSKLKIANSIWYKDYVEVKNTFLQNIVDSYKADIYQTKENSDATKLLNNWVKKNTDGMIDKLFNDDEAKDFAMILANAVVFDGKWAKKFEVEKNDSIFTSASGEKHNVNMMYSQDESYLKTDKAQGFIKSYKGNKYSFMAILPNDDVNINDYVKSFTFEEYKKLIGSKGDFDVKANIRIPGFKIKYSMELKDVLKTMGINDAFDGETANFQDMAERKSLYGNLYIDKFIHRTYIEFDENGTKAAAVTGSGMKDEAYLPDEKIELVYDSPFIYAIIDNATDIPIFMGVAMDIK